VLDSSDVIRAEDEKLLIFTEHRDTLNSLAKRLEDKGYTVATIHGGMDVDSRKQAQRQFRTRAKIMVATDAAGEGINLQFCRYLINWDIPWNPNRLEQRMGRIHRYGQADDVWVYNLVAQNTREGSVLQKVLSKLDVMREQMGSDRVYDVIDEWLEDVPLVRLIESAIDSDDESASARETDAALTTASNERAARLMALQKKTSLASRLDLRSARELRDASDERRLQPLFIQRFFERAWTACGRTITSLCGTSARRRPPSSNSPASAGSLSPTTTTPPSCSTNSSSASRARCVSPNGRSSWDPGIRSSTR
jgi:superfamily II DNA/RNA helicase